MKSFGKNENKTEKQFLEAGKNYPFLELENIEVIQKFDNYVEVEFICKKDRKKTIYRGVVFEWDEIYNDFPVEIKWDQNHQNWVLNQRKIAKKTFAIKKLDENSVIFEDMEAKQFKVFFKYENNWERFRIIFNCGLLVDGIITTSKNGENHWFWVK